MDQGGVRSVTDNNRGQFVDLRQQMRGIDLGS